MQTWLRQHAQVPEYRLTAAEVRGLNNDKALYSSLQDLRDGEKKLYERSFLKSLQIRANANMGSPVTRELFGRDRRMTNKDLAEAALQAPASLAGLQMARHLGMPSSTVPTRRAPPPPPAPGGAAQAAAAQVQQVVMPVPAPMTADASTEVKGQKEITKEIKRAGKVAEKAAGTPAKGTPAKGTPGGRRTPQPGSPAPKSRGASPARGMPMPGTPATYKDGRPIPKPPPLSSKPGRSGAAPSKAPPSRK